ncbi:uncharacterized protein CTRU02_215211 [Colletotrichum truncatum]|uniref:Uncharacterized protein n=1 Tax=Colletotrichum truncatum TaxID=5467 RepID=A0ACC3YD52_COLTU|nr:uncharacterized protein CTRU02_12251 [Colletotrichum truncatum]KAF6784790.1 hypothetical protein CTRU02_12251 [Colletotrichum truncatum]
MLPGSSRQTVYSLYGRQNGQDAYNIEARLRTNSYAVSGGPTEDWPGSDYDAMFAVHANISKINHSCRPNAAPQWDWDLFAHNLYAVRDVAAGEEITISYLGANYALLPSQERKQYLNSSLGFDCVCDHCKAAQKFVDLSDDRINEILLLERHLEDKKIAPAEPTAMAELLVSLYKQEGLELFISKAYAIAAREWNGAGYEYQARLWAYQSLKASTISSLSSGAEEYVEDMNDLLNGARHHWSWKYRVR